MKLSKQIIFIGYVCCSVADSYSYRPVDSLTSDTILHSDIQEVIILATRPSTKLSADKVTFNPSSLGSRTNGNAYEALQSLPGITIGADGEIVINGSQGITFNIDGRKTILNGENLIHFLKSIPIADIENIEIINSIGAKADGSDPTTILNLIRRRNKDDCYSIGANIDGEIWKARQMFGSVFGEYYRNRHGVSANFSRYIAHNPSELLTDRPYLDFLERLKQEYNRKRNDSSHFLSFSYEYRPSEYSVIGTTINYNRFRRNEDAEMTTSVPLVSKSIVTSNNAKFITNNLWGEIYIKRNSSDKSFDWMAACDFFSYKTLEGQLMEDNTGMSVDGNMTGKTYGIVGTFDFNKSISKHWRFSGGGRVSYVDMNNEGLYDGISSKEAKPTSAGIDNLTSSFGYDENVNALYAEGKCEYGILTANVGLRGEQSRLTTFFSGNESAESCNISKCYFHLYPSLSILVSTSDFGSWMLTYANKVTRPRFADLDPFIHLFDDITHVGGNINLKESNRHSFNIIWSDNSHLRIITGGEIIHNEIVKYYRELNYRIVYVTPENIPSLLQLNLSLMGSNLCITPWWTMSATANIIYSVYRFAKHTGLSPNSLWTPTMDLKNVFRLPYQISLEINSSVRGRMAFGQARTSTVWNTYAGFQKSFCDGRLSLSLYLKDIFNSNSINSTILLSGKKAFLYEKEFEDMRKIGISLSWRIRGGTGNSKKETRNVWIDELNRVNL